MRFFKLFFILGLAALLGFSLLLVERSVHPRPISLEKLLRLQRLLAPR